jgi:hypothetical protein
LNPAFGAGGQVQLTLSSSFTVTSPVAIDHDSRDIGGVETEIFNDDGTASLTYAVFALGPDGQIDPNFGGSAGPGFSAVLPNAAAQISGLAIDAKNRIVATAASAQGVAAVIERLLPDGTLDVTFGQNGIAVVPMPPDFTTYFSENMAVDSTATSSWPVK